MPINLLFLGKNFCSWICCTLFYYGWMSLWIFISCRGHITSISPSPLSLATGSYVLLWSFYRFQRESFTARELSPAKFLHGKSSDIRSMLAFLQIRLWPITPTHNLSAWKGTLIVWKHYIKLWSHYVTWLTAVDFPGNNCGYSFPRAVSWNPVSSLCFSMAREQAVTQCDVMMQI